MTAWPGWRIDLAWRWLPRIKAYRSLYDGTAARLKPDALYQMAMAAGLPETEAEELRDARETAIAEDAYAEEA